MFAFCQCLLSIELICRQITCDLYQQVIKFPKKKKIKTKLTKTNEGFFISAALLYLKKRHDDFSVIVESHTSGFCSRVVLELDWGHIIYILGQ